MISQRLTSRFFVRKGLFDRSIRIPTSRPIHSLSSLFQIRTGHGFSPGLSENLKVQSHLVDSIVPRFLGNLGMKLGFTQSTTLPCTVNFRSFIHSVGPKEFEMGRDTRAMETERNTGTAEVDRSIRSVEMDRNTRPNEMGWNAGLFEMGRDSRPFDSGRNTGPSEIGRNTRSMNVVRGIIEDNGRDISGGSQLSRYSVEQNADIVHIKLMRNNTFVTVTDSKGNRKCGASSGCLAEMKGGPKASRYGAEATAEYVGRLAKNMGLKSVVVKVNGFTHFKKKKQAILSFRDGYTHSRNDQNPIVYIEDTTRKPHNGCRLRKKRRV